MVDAHNCSILGMKLVPGHPNDQDACCSELPGLFGAVVLLANFSLLLGWDAFRRHRSRLWQTLRSFQGILHLAPHFDMLSALCLMISSSTLTWTTRHVAGCQAGDPTAALDWWALQNVQMDALAKAFQMQHSHSALVLCPLCNADFQAWLGNCRFSSHEEPAIFFDHLRGKTILNWRSSHHCFPACSAPCIDWKDCAAAFQPLFLGRPCLVSKHTSGHCSALLEPCFLFSQKDSQPPISPAATCLRKLGTSDCVKNRQSSLCGGKPFLCPPLANGLSQCTLLETLSVESFSA